MVPALTPVAVPVADPIVATAVALLLQVPPPASLNAVVALTHTDLVPVMEDGSAFTVNTAAAVQPVGIVYVMAVVPADTPVTTPVPDPIVATAVLLLVQVPPPASLSVVVSPAHTFVVPLIAAGSGFTDAAKVVLQPVPRV